MTGLESENALEGFHCPVTLDVEAALSRLRKLSS